MLLWRDRLVRSRLNSELWTLTGAIIHKLSVHRLRQWVWSKWRVWTHVCVGDKKEGAEGSRSRPVRPAGILCCFCSRCFFIWGTKCLRCWHIDSLITVKSGTSALSDQTSSVTQTPRRKNNYWLGIVSGLWLRGGVTAGNNSKNARNTSLQHWQTRIYIFLMTNITCLVATVTTLFQLSVN